MYIIVSSIYSVRWDARELGGIIDAHAPDLLPLCRSDYSILAHNMDNFNKSNDVSVV
jgi:hypothetical protein